MLFDEVSRGRQAGMDHGNISLRNVDDFFEACLPRFESHRRRDDTRIDHAGCQRGENLRAGLQIEHLDVLTRDRPASWNKMRAKWSLMEPGDRAETTLPRRSASD